MSSSPEPETTADSRPSARAETRRFARRLLLAMGALAALATASAVVVARGHLARVQAAEAELRFAAIFAGERALQSLRASALADRARVLATRPRIHAALEDDALDLLYLAAHDDLRDTLRDPAAPVAAPGLRARFYRLADAAGRLVPPPAHIDAGPASPRELETAARLATIATTHSARAWENTGADGSVELLAQPLFSNADGRRIGLLVLGYDEAPPAADATAQGLPGRWTGDALHAPLLPAALREEATSSLAPALADAPPSGHVRLRLGGADWLILHRRESASDQGAISAYRSLWFAPLDDLARRQREATWSIVGAGALLALGGVAVASLFTAGFGGWFGRLAGSEERQRARRAEAESRLARTAAELDRAARFSADASHQLKTPVAVLRLGLDELAAEPAFPASRLGDVEELRRQTERLSHIIDDLLLLARLDAGFVRPADEPLDLAALAAAALDDISALPEGETLRLLDEIGAPLPVRGDRRLLALVLQNLSENAAKYNAPGGLVRLRVESDADTIRLHVENTAPRPVPLAARERIFERFQRGEAGSEKPGHGLGLNLARDIARLHGGDLALGRSDAELTVFTLSLPRA